MKSSKSKREIIVASIIYIIMSILYPYLLAALPIFIYFIIKIVKSNKKGAEINLKLEEAQDKYNDREYNGVIEILSSLPLNILNSDLDLQMKLADCYLNLQKYSEAENIYIRLLKINPNSNYIKEKLGKINSK